MLRTHETKTDEGKQVDGTGDQGFFNEYARWLAQDTSALVDGEPKGLSGLIKTLKRAEVDGAAVAEELIDSLIGSGSWQELNEPDKKSMVESVAKEADLQEKEETDTLDSYIAVYDFGENYKEEISNWMRSKLSALSEATTIGAIGSIPEKWHADLAYLLYEATKTAYYGEALIAPFVPPFKRLIGDVNDGSVTRFDYVRKYGAASEKWGAEFTVASPAPMKDKYDGKAVLHTHYAAADAEPNYAHTKPEDKKLQPGFGYTVVTTSKVTAVADTSDTWDDLT